jgi:hypothetical protein
MLKRYPQKVCLSRNFGPILGDESEYLTQTRKRVIIARNDGVHLLGHDTLHSIPNEGIYLENWHPAFGTDED